MFENTREPKSRSNVISTRACSAANEKTSTSDIPRRTSVTATTSCPPVRSAAVLAVEMFSSAKNRNYPVFRFEG